MTQASQSHLAYLALEKLIVTLGVEPGAIVNERQLIELTGHGRTPVREAIQRLAWENLIRIRPRVGLQVAQISPRDRGNILQARQQLEPLAVHLAAQNICDPLREQLENCTGKMVLSAKNDDILTFYEADKHLDEIVAVACPNNFIASSLWPLQTHFRRIWFSSADSAALQTAVQMHLDIINALLDGNSERAEQADTRLLSHHATH
ncbi:GntR family transcriptional regulator [Agrobacterium sp.]|jgi:DNA-binding GntR family transcriptional regulator|uniref:GntR family transcriptional regulator n=1 Tax=Agrobacterium sp. TaxID=361 RepID=UPI0028AF99F0|nr:GntR family transcriptional regulator [Agrobacterium sp.]